MKKTLPLFTLSFILIFLLHGCATYTSVRQHEDFQDSAKQIKSVVVLPPQVEIEMIVFSGENTPLDDKEHAISKEITSLAASRLSQEGLEVVDFDFNQAIKEDEEFAYAVTQCEESLKNATQDLYNGTSVTVENKSNFKANIGPVVNAIAEKTGAESVLFMEYYGFEKSGGMVAKDITAAILLGALTGSVPVTPSSGSALNIALIDSTNGDILWNNVKSGPVLDGSLVNTNFDEFPDMTWESELAE